MLESLDDDYTRLQAEMQEGINVNNEFSSVHDATHYR